MNCTGSSATAGCHNRVTRSFIISAATLSGQLNVCATDRDNAFDLLEAPMQVHKSLIGDLTDIDHVPLENPHLYQAISSPSVLTLYTNLSEHPFLAA